MAKKQEFAGKKASPFKIYMVKARLRLWWALLNRRPPAIYDDAERDNTLAFSWYLTHGNSVLLKRGKYTVKGNG